MNNFTKKYNEIFKKYNLKNTHISSQEFINEGAILDFFSDVGSKVASGFKSAGNAIVSGTKYIGGKIADGFNWTVNQLKNILDKGIEFFKDQMQKLFDTIVSSETLANARTTVLDIFNKCNLNIISEDNNNLIIEDDEDDESWWVPDWLADIKKSVQITCKTLYTDKGAMEFGNYLATERHMSENDIKNLTILQAKSELFNYIEKKKIISEEVLRQNGIIIENNNIIAEDKTIIAEASLFMYLVIILAIIISLWFLLDKLQTFGGKNGNGGKGAGASLTEYKNEELKKLIVVLQGCEALK